MKKDEWIDILKNLDNKDWTDWLVITVSIISPILVLISVIYSAKAANAAKKATDLNLKMYIEQKEERERSFLPIFKISNFINEGHFIYFELINHNNNGILVTNHVVEESVDYTHHESDEKIISITAYDDFIKKDYFKLWLYYTTLDHRNYCSEIVLRIVGDELVIQTPHKLTKRD